MKTFRKHLIKWSAVLTMVKLAAATTRSRQERWQYQDATSYLTVFDMMAQDSIVTFAEPLM